MQLCTPRQIDTNTTHLSLESTAESASADVTVCAVLNVAPITSSCTYEH